MAKRNWDLALQELERTSRPAADLVHTCAFIASSPLPWAFLMEALAVVHAERTRRQGGEHRLTTIDAVLTVLRSHSLIQIIDGAVSIPTPLQAVVRTRMPEYARRAYLEFAVASLMRSFPGIDDPGSREACAEWVPHILAAAKHSAISDQAQAHIVPLLTGAGLCLHSAGKYTDAAAVYQTAVEIAEWLHGLESSKLASVLLDLSASLREVPDLEAARAACERALTIQERQLPQRAVDLVDTLRGLGLILIDQEHADRAVEHLNRALTICLDYFGSS